MTIETARFIGGPLGGEVQHIGREHPDVLRWYGYGRYVHLWCPSLEHYDRHTGLTVYRRIDDGEPQPVYEYCGQDPVIVTYTANMRRRYGYT